MIRLLSPRHIAGLLVVLIAGLASAQEQPKTEQEWIATLQSPTASHYEKGLACRQLAVVGGEAAIPALANLLDDPKLAHLARFGLEPMQSPKVDQVLAQAAKRLKGRALIGVVNSIGNRGKAAGIDAVQPLLDDADQAVVKAAAHTIARLGTSRSVELLKPRLNGDFAAACLVCGETLARQGQKEAAAEMLRAVGECEQAAGYIRLAALHQAVKFQVVDDMELLTMALGADIPEVFQMGLRVARLPEAKNSVAATLEVMPSAPASRQALLITLLGDLQDPAGLPAVLKAAESSDVAVRVAAIEALAHLGSARQVTLLVDAAGDSEPAVAAAALGTLSQLEGDEVDDAVLKLLADPGRQSIAIRLVGQRRISSAVPQLMRLIDGNQRLAVIAALGETIDLAQLDVLGKRLADANAESREAIRKAFHAACYRMPDRDATASRVAGYLDSAQPETVAFLMDELRTIGGDQALATVAKAASGKNETLKDYATQALGKWLDTSADQALLQLSQREGDSKYGIRCLNGYIRLIRQFSMPVEQRVAMARQALQLAERAREKTAVLEALARYPSVATLAVVAEASTDSELKAEAQGVALQMAQKIRGQRQAVRAALNTIGLKPRKIEITKAEYGAADHWKDVTAALRNRTRGFSLIVLGDGNYNKIFGGDPAPGVAKVLKIEYRIDGKSGSVTLKENAPVLLPEVK